MLPGSFLLPFTQPLGGASWFWACLSPTSAASLFAAALVNWERLAEGARRAWRGAARRGSACRARPGAAAGLVRPFGCGAIPVHGSEARTPTRHLVPRPTRTNQSTPRARRPPRAPAARAGVTWRTLWLPVTQDSSFCAAHVLMLLAADVPLYAAAAWYLEKAGREALLRARARPPFCSG
jgi:hypothetical protein